MILIHMPLMLFSAMIPFAWSLSVRPPTLVKSQAASRLKFDLAGLGTAMESLSLAEKEKSAAESRDAPFDTPLVHETGDASSFANDDDTHHPVRTASSAAPLNDSYSGVVINYKTGPGVYVRLKGKRVFDALPIPRGYLLFDSDLEGDVPAGYYREINEGRWVLIADPDDVDKVQRLWVPHDGIFPDIPEKPESSPPHDKYVHQDIDSHKPLQPNEYRETNVGRFVEIGEGDGLVNYLWVPHNPADRPRPITVPARHDDELVVQSVEKRGLEKRFQLPLYYHPNHWETYHDQQPDTKSVDATQCSCEAPEFLEDDDYDYHQNMPSVKNPAAHGNYMFNPGNIDLRDGNYAW